MICEIASLLVRTDQKNAFTSSFRVVTHLLKRAKGYEGYVLTQGVERLFQAGGLTFFVA